MPSARQRSVAHELPARGRGAKANQVRDVSLVDVGVVALPLSLGGGGPVALAGQLDRANWQGVVRARELCWEIAQETAAEKSSTSSRVGMLRETAIRRLREGKGGVQAQGLSSKQQNFNKAPSHNTGHGTSKRILPRPRRYAAAKEKRSLCVCDWEGTYASTLSHVCSVCVHVLGGHLPTCSPLWREGPARGARPSS